MLGSFSKAYNRHSKIAYYSLCNIITKSFYFFWEYNMWCIFLWSESSFPPSLFRWLIVKSCKFQLYFYLSLSLSLQNDKHTIYNSSIYIIMALKVIQFFLCIRIHLLLSCIKKYSKISSRICFLWTLLVFLFSALVENLLNSCCLFCRKLLLVV